MIAASHQSGARTGLLAALLGHLTPRSRRNMPRLHVEALSDAMRQDLGLSDGRPHPPRDLLRD